jgi:hypothetical protein
LFPHEGFKVALVEHHEDLEAFKQLCTHFVQASFSNDSSSLPRRRTLRRRGNCTRTRPDDRPGKAPLARFPAVRDLDQPPSPSCSLRAARSGGVRVERPTLIADIQHHARFINQR